MRILLKNFATGLYLAEGGKWTRSAARALCFPNAVMATAHKIKNHLADTFAVVLPEMSRSLALPQTN
jgi:hypothetical protein